VPTPKVIAMFVAWVLASVMMAVVTAIIVTEILRAIGIVDSGSSSYSIAINLTFVLVFAALVAVPFVFRRRFALDANDES
jgi:hypothetical protein